MSGYLLLGFADKKDADALLDTLRPRIGENDLYVVAIHDDPRRMIETAATLLEDDDQ